MNAFTPETVDVDVHLLLGDLLALLDAPQHIRRLQSATRTIVSQGEKVLLFTTAISPPSSGKYRRICNIRDGRSKRPGARVARYLEGALQLQEALVGLHVGHAREEQLPDLHTSSFQVRAMEHPGFIQLPQTAGSWWRLLVSKHSMPSLFSFAHTHAVKKSDVRPSRAEHHDPCQNTMQQASE